MLGTYGKTFNLILHVSEAVEVGRVFQGVHAGYGHVG